MCGIAGIFNLNSSPASRAIIEAMTAQIGHRGPDGEGYYVKDNIALGHRRLAILDTSSSGSQPMESNNGEWMVIFNGCIYNYREIKAELISKGHTFQRMTLAD